MSFRSASGIIGQRVVNMQPVFVTGIYVFIINEKGQHGSRRNESQYVMSNETLELQFHFVEHMLSGSWRQKCNLS